MNNRLDTKDVKVIFDASSEMATSLHVMRNTPEAKKAIGACNELTAKIRMVTAEAKSIEDLIHLEMVMQRLDKSQATAKQDKAGIEKAENGYLSLADNVQQMRDNPAEYFRSNTGNAEIKRDIHKIPDWRCSSIIQGNRVRMQNRAAFAPEEQRGIWEARIALADKTERMYKTLHENLAADFERKRKTLAGHAAGQEQQ